MVIGENSSDILHIVYQYYHPSSPSPAVPSASLYQGIIPGDSISHEVSSERLLFFERLSPIGSGKFGDVYKGELHSQHGPKHVAIRQGKGSAFKNNAEYYISDKSSSASVY